MRRVAAYFSHSIYSSGSAFFEDAVLNTKHPGFDDTKVAGTANEYDRKVFRASRLGKAIAAFNVNDLLYAARTF